MINSQSGRFLSVSFSAVCRSRYAVSTKISFRPLERINSDRLLMPEFKRITLQQECLITASAKCLKWLKTEQRKEYNVTAEEFKTAIDNDEVYVVDVREPFEVAKGRVPAKRYVNIPIGIIFIALRLPEEEFEKHFKVPKPQKSDTIVFMCMGGVRSTFCLGAAQDFGFENSKHFDGGWHEWNSTYPMLKE